jgi:hypothetical protein
MRPASRRDNAQRRAIARACQAPCRPAAMCCRAYSERAAAAAIFRIGRIAGAPNRRRRRAANPRHNGRRPTAAESIASRRSAAVMPRRFQKAHLPEEGRNFLPRICSGRKFRRVNHPQNPPLPEIVTLIARTISTSHTRGQVTDGSTHCGGHRVGLGEEAEESCPSSRRR